MTDGLSELSWIFASPAVRAQGLIHLEGKMTGCDYAPKDVLCPRAK